MKPAVPTMAEAAGATIGGLLRRGESGLAHAGIANAEREAVWILEHALGMTELQLRLNDTRAVEPAGQRRAEALLARRAGREPLQYLLGAQEFCGLEFHVEPGVLIPRPETELLVDEVVRRSLAASSATPVLADIGTGSGCIAVALARALPRASVYATDCSAAALTVAVRNAKRHGVADRITFLGGDLLEPLRACGLEGGLSVIVANPPYIPDHEWSALQPEVKLFEPRLALAGGADGLAIHRRLLRDAVEWLAPGGRLLVEVGQGQAEPLRRLARDSGQYGRMWTRRDGAGIERVVCVEKSDE